MKKHIFSLLVFICLISILAISCKKSKVQDLSPTLEFTAEKGYISSDTTWPAGDTATIELKCKSDGTDAVRTIFIYYNNKQLGNPIEIDPINGQEYSHKLKITKTQFSVENYSFEIIDSRGQMASASLKIQLDNSGGEVETVQSQVGVQQNPSIGIFFGFTEKKNYLQSVAEANQGSVDMIGGYDFFVRSFFTSPASDENYEVFDFSSWSTRKLTLFCYTNISSAQFALINKDNLLISAFHPDKSVYDINNLKINRVYSFKTQEGRYGLIKIIGEAISESGWISFDYKIQVAPPAKK